MKTFSMTHVGQRRETNQDYMYTSETSVGRLPDLFLVADGMGGHAAGDYASRFTVEKIVEYVTESEESEPVTVLGEAVRYANEHLLAEANADASKAGMGTTIVAAVVVGDKLYTANVGDSPVVCDQPGTYHTDYKRSLSGRRDGSAGRDGQRGCKSAPG